jgi:hypothetical protein
MNEMERFYSGVRTEFLNVKFTLTCYLKDKEPNVENSPNLVANQQVNKYHVMSLFPLTTNRQAGVTAALVCLWHYVRWIAVLKGRTITV